MSLETDEMNHADEHWLGYSCYMFHNKKQFCYNERVNEARRVKHV